jgi:hypothetical protein
MKNQMAYQTPMVVIANMKPASMVLAGSLTGIPVGDPVDGGEGG